MATKSNKSYFKTSSLILYSYWRLEKKDQLLMIERVSFVYLNFEEEMFKYG